MKSIRFVLLLSIFSINAAANDCADLKRQMRNMDQNQRQTLREERFVYGVRAEGLPLVVISPSVIRGCKNRLVAEKYFHNKINGKSDLVYSKEEFDTAKKDISYAACEALKTSVPWIDGVSHEITNIVSDDLQPYWNSCIAESVRLGKGLDLTLLTDSMFLNAPPKLLVLVNRLIRSESTDALDLGVAYIIKKNAGEMLNLDDIENRLRSARALPVNMGHKTETVVKGWMSLLRREGKISINEVRNFVYELF